MRKLFLFLVIMFICTSSYADIISYDDLVSGGDVTISYFNGMKNTIIQTINGNIEAINIASDTLSDDNMVPGLKMANWYDESLGDWTYSGMLAPTSASLSSTTTAGTSYINGVRQQTSATVKSYTASKDTWVYIDSDGSFQYEEVATGAAQPSTPANSLLLFKVSADAATINTVTDYRQLTPPQLRVYQNYRQGCILSYDTASTIKINPGEIELGAGTTAGKRRNTSAIQLTWSNIDILSEDSSTEYYVWVYPDPDNTTNFLGKISASSTDPIGITNERLIGSFWNDASSNISPDNVATYKGDGSGVPNVAFFTNSDDTSTTSDTWVDMDNMSIKFYSSGRPVKIRADIGAGSNDATMTPWFRLLVDGDEWCWAQIPANNRGHCSLIYENELPEDWHTAHVEWRRLGAAGTAYAGGQTYGNRSIIVIEE